MIRPENSSQQYETPDLESIGLPTGSNLTIPSLAISFVNRSIRAAYPQHYGKEIPVLRDESVRVVSKPKMDAFEKISIDHQSHPLIRTYQEARNQHFSTVGGPINVTMKTISERQGRPVLVTDSFLHSLRQFTEPTYSEAIAYLLIHEDFHRASKERFLVIDPGDLIYYRVALAVRLSEINFAGDQHKPFLQEQLDILNNYASSHEAILRIDGALAQLYSLDEADGQMKRFFDNGYDLNEALVELLSERPRQKLYDIIRGNHHPLEAARMIDALMENQDSSSSVQARRIPRDILLDYCHDMGLGEDDEILRAYLQSELPLLHAQNLPNEIYL